MTMLAALQLIMLAWLAFALAASALAAALLPWALRATVTWAPERRHRALLLLSAAPLVTAFVALLAALGPSLLSLLYPEHDHCLSHGDGHVHLCLLHPPPHLGNVASCVAFVLGMGWIGVRLAFVLLRLQRARRCVARLRSHGTDSPQLRANVLPTSTPLCALAGVLQPTLFLSAGLLARVTEHELPVILQHERAHAARRDLLLFLIARAGSAFLWPAARARLLAALQLAAEQSCDEVAASHVGDRLQVAAVILKVERMLQPVPQLGSLALAFGGSGVPQRVLSLLDARSSRGSLTGMALLFALLLAALLLASAPLHHFTESVLGQLTH